jgi:hypothetical protein
MCGYTLFRGDVFWAEGWSSGCYMEEDCKRR